MKKKAQKRKKLQLSRETLRALSSSEAQKVIGGAIVASCPTRCPDGNTDYQPCDTI
jgi:hypothetical protein